MKKRTLIILAFVLLLAIPALAVFNEKNLAQTLSVLRYELKTANDKMEERRRRFDSTDHDQHARMISIIKKCNELSLILYSQNPDCTFDLTYALKEVTQEYENYNASRMPYDDIVAKLTLEIDRYSRLVTSLKRFPPVVQDDYELPDSLVFVDSTALRVKTRIDSLIAVGEIDTVGMAERRKAFQLDSAGVADRDSCLRYATNLLLLYTEIREHLISDNGNYEDARDHLQEAYDYAQNRYKQIQHNIFIEGQDNYFDILPALPHYTQYAFSEAADKYGISARTRDRVILDNSEWRGRAVLGVVGGMLASLLAAFILTFAVVTLLRWISPRFKDEANRRRLAYGSLLFAVLVFSLAAVVISRISGSNFFRMACKLMLSYSWLLGAILLSLLIRSGSNEDTTATRSSLKVYLPVILLGFLIIAFRISFIPNRMLNLFFPPILLGFTIWQLVTCNKSRGKVDSLDIILAWISFVLMLAATIMSMLGFVLLSVQIFIWWLFQLSAVATIVAAYEILNIYKRKKLDARIEESKEENRINIPQMKSGAYIRITWFFDLIRMVALPCAAVLSLPLCLWEAADIFDLTSVCQTIFYDSFLNYSNSKGEVVLNLSLYKLLLGVCLFFIFRYVNYVLRSMYALITLQAYKRKMGREEVRSNEINFTLANNIISILVWGVYIITIVMIMKIPLGAVSIILAGLATGIGLAMKDILNNFIYGIQLMSGRLRVGDYIECDGVRGKVTEISYQSTQIETIYGAVMSFLNADLFSRNFQNLTRNNSYEYLKIIVGVAYGTDVETARQVILSAIMQLTDRRDEYGRPIVDTQKGVLVAFEGFDASSINLAVKQYVLVVEKYNYNAAAQELIYNALGKAGIEIPFPQIDVHQK
ncbi:MAG: mechanosensitive ion channel family protein [Bacteroidales bacterium]|nr:mechanosensitive ion channel family protein [Bacteroidales bacterium]